MPRFRSKYLAYWLAPDLTRPLPVPLKPDYPPVSAWLLNLGSSTSLVHCFCVSKVEWGYQKLSWEAKYTQFLWQLMWEQCFSCWDTSNLFSTNPNRTLTLKKKIEFCWTLTKLLTMCCISTITSKRTTRYLIRPLMMLENKESNYVHRHCQECTHLSMRAIFTTIIDIDNIDSDYKYRHNVY